MEVYYSVEKRVDFNLFQMISHFPPNNLLNKTVSKIFSVAHFISTINFLEIFVSFSRITILFC